MEQVKLTSRQSLFCLLGISFIVYILGLLKNGVFYGGDSKRYLENAHQILQTGSIQDYISYLGYSSLVSLIKLVTEKDVAIVFVQILVALAAVYSLYRITERIFDQRSAFMATVLFALNPDFFRWHYYILTDSTYISFLLITVWQLMNAAEKGGLYWISALLCLFFTSILRPHGLLFFPLGLWFIGFSVFQSTQKRILFLSILVPILLVLAAVPPIRNALSGANADGEFGVIICNYGWKLEMPDKEQVHSLATLFSWILRHPIDASRLFVVRIGAELLHVRPFYSRAHNILVLIFLIPIYFFSAIGIARSPRNLKVALLIAVVAVHLSIVAITYADWDGRFLLYFLPMLLCFSGKGLSDCVRLGDGIYHRQRLETH